MLRLVTILSLMILFSNRSFCQNQSVINSATQKTPSPQPKFLQTDSGFYIIQTLRKGCKSIQESGDFFPIIEKVIIAAYKEQSALPVMKKNIIIHGNIGYDFFYRSRIDTPINQQNFQQHTERVNLDILVKEKYPLKASFSARQSNSPYFRNFIDANFNFDRFAYNKNLKQKLVEKLKTKIPVYAYPDLAKIEGKIKEQAEEYKLRKDWLENPFTLQKIVEEREKQYYKKLKEKDDSIQLTLQVQFDKKKSNNINENKDSISIKKLRLFSKKDSLIANIKNNADSVTYPFARLYETKKRELDSLTKKIDANRKKADSLKNVVQKDVASVQQKIYKAINEKELRKIASENGIVVDGKDKFEKRLSAIKTLGLGRSVLNYTELTAQNITVTGVNIEYNPNYYVAFTAGKIDYRFRDFFNRSSQHNNQYITMGRVGVGDKERKALIFSYFTGRKSNSNYGFSDSIKSTVNLMGYSVEAIYKKDENTSLSAEFAKSTKPVTGNLQTNKQTGFLLKFNDESNMGINIKAKTIIPETNTKLSGFFRKTGEKFQSFSLFSYNTDQTAWLARADQSFLKNKITLTGMLRRNDFSNPFTDKTYKTSTLFKSIQLGVRVPKYPALSVGYYPGTQLYMIDKEKIRESAYYILNGSVVYSYFFKSLAMNSLVVYNKYTSEATDSGFIAYKGINYYISQSVFLRKLQVQAGYAYTKQPILEYYTLETTEDFALRNWLKIGVGAKYNSVCGGNNYWGKSVQLKTDFKQFGSIQLQYEKSYLPSINQNLYPVETGRLSYYKNF